MDKRGRVRYFHHVRDAFGPAPRSAPGPQGVRTDVAFPFKEFAARLAFRGWDLANRWAFGLRRSGFHPKTGLEIPSEPLEGLYPEGSAAEQERMRLTEAYGLEWADERPNFRENLHVVGLLEAALAEHAAELPSDLSVLDVGAKDWHHLPGMARFLRRVGSPDGRSPSLSGIELDPYFRYDDGYTRYDYAQAYMRGYPDCRYRVGDVREHVGRYDLALVLFPFWREREVLDWGLPGRFFDIDGLLTHARAQVRPGGLLLVTAYRSEAPWAEPAIGRLDWRVLDRGEWRSPFIKTSPILWWLFRA